MACVLAVVVESVGVGREGEGALVLFPKAVDGLGHVGRTEDHLYFVEGFSSRAKALSV